MKLLLDSKTINIIVADTFYKRLKGLIGVVNINYGMIFYNCNAVHTYFMKENIDIIGLNENMEIIFIEQDCKPNKLIKINRSIKKTSILELPSNTSNELSIGMKVNLN